MKENQDTTNFDYDYLGDEDMRHLDVLHITVDDGSHLECYVLGTYEVEGQTYIALLPKDGEQTLVYRYREGEDGPILNRIEDEQEYQAVSREYYRLFAPDDTEANPSN